MDIPWSAISKGIGGALLGFPERYPSPYSATYATARSPKDLPAGVPLHHLRRYQSFSFRYTVPATNKQRAFPPNNTTARSTEDSIHLSWLAYFRHLRYDIPNMFHIKLHAPWRITRLALSLPVTYCPLMLRDGPTGSTLTRAPASSPWGLMDETGHDPVTYGL